MKIKMKLYKSNTAIALFMLFMSSNTIKSQVNADLGSSLFYPKGTIISFEKYTVYETVSEVVDPFIGEIQLYSSLRLIKFIEDTNKVIITGANNKTFIPLTALLYSKPDSIHKSVGYFDLNDCYEKTKVEGFYLKIISQNGQKISNKVYCPPGYHFQGKNSGRPNQQKFQLKKYIQLNNNLSEYVLNSKVTDKLGTEKIIEDFKVYLKNIKKDCSVSDGKEEVIWTNYLYDVDDTTSKIQLLYEDDIEVQIDTVNNILTTNLRDIYNFKEQEFTLEFKFHPGETVTYFSLINIDAPKGCYWGDSKYKGLVCE